MFGRGFLIFILGVTQSSSLVLPRAKLNPSTSHTIKPVRFDTLLKVTQGSPVRRDFKNVKFIDLDSLQSNQEALSKLFQIDKIIDETPTNKRDDVDQKVEIIDITDKLKKWQKNSRDQKDSDESQIKLVDLKDLKNSDIERLLYKKGGDVKRVNIDKLKRYDLDALFNTDKQSKINLVNLDILNGDGDRPQATTLADSKEDNVENNRDFEAKSQSKQRYKGRNTQDRKQTEIKILNLNKSDLAAVLKNYKNSAIVDTGEREEIRFLDSQSKKYDPDRDDLAYNLKNLQKPIVYGETSPSNTENVLSRLNLKGEKSDIILEDIHNAILKLSKQDKAKKILERKHEDTRIMKQLLDLTNPNLDISLHLDNERPKPVDLDELGRAIKNMADKRAKENERLSRLGKIFDENGMYYITMPKKNVDRQLKYLLNKLVLYKNNPDKKVLRQPSEVFTESEMQRVKQISDAFEHGESEKPIARQGQQESEVQTQFEFSSLVQ